MRGWRTGAWEGEQEMQDRRGAILASVVAIALLAGILITFFATGGGLQARQENVSVRGEAYVRVYDPSGNLILTWQGHNSLFPISKNAIAQCVSGLTVNPPGYLGCSRPDDLMWIYWSSGGTTYYDLESTSGPGVYATPEPNCANVFCPFWDVTATFTGFTQSNCGVACTVTGANAGAACGSTYTFTPNAKITSSITRCFAESNNFQSSTSCATTYNYDAAGNVVSATTGSCTSAAGAFPVQTGAHVLPITFPTYPTLCDSDGNCGQITRDANQHTVSNQFVGFDTLPSAIILGQGDTLVITIEYTVA